MSMARYNLKSFQISMPLVVVRVIIVYHFNSIQFDRRVRPDEIISKFECFAETDDLQLEKNFDSPR